MENRDGRGIPTECQYLFFDSLWAAQELAVPPSSCIALYRLNWHQSVVGEKSRLHSSPSVSDSGPASMSVNALITTVIISEA
jgi:hypothetical protein